MFVFAIAIAASGLPVHSSQAQAQQQSSVADPLKIAGDPQYELIEITAPAGSLGIGAEVINDRGAVSAGFLIATNEFHAFVFENGVFKEFQHPGSTITSLLAMDNGMLFGNWGDFSSQTAGMYDPETDQWTALPDVPGKLINIGYRMNGAGVGVGYACEGDWVNSFNCVGWTWNPHRREYQFPTYPGATETKSLGINNRKEIVGSAFLTSG